MFEKWFKKSGIDERAKDAYRECWEVAHAMTLMQTVLTISHTIRIHTRILEKAESLNEAERSNHQLIKAALGEIRTKIAELPVI